jgi:hypothetical protein
MRESDFHRLGEEVWPAIYQEDSLTGPNAEYNKRLFVTYITEALRRDDHAVLQMVNMYHERTGDPRRSLDVLPLGAANKARIGQLIFGSVADRWTPEAIEAALLAFDAPRRPVVDPMMAWYYQSNNIGPREARTLVDALVWAHDRAGERGDFYGAGAESIYDEIANAGLASHIEVSILDYIDVHSQDEEFPGWYIDQAPEVYLAIIEDFLPGLRGPQAITADDIEAVMPPGLDYHRVSDFYFIIEGGDHLANEDGIAPVVEIMWPWPLAAVVMSQEMYTPHDGEWSIEYNEGHGGHYPLSWSLEWSNTPEMYRPGSIRATTREEALGWLGRALLRWQQENT